MASRPTPESKSAAKAVSPAKAGRAPGAKAVSQAAASKAAKVAAPKDAPPAATVKSTVGPDTSAAVIAKNVKTLKKKDLIDRVLGATGAKKALVKEIVEATLAVLGDALSKGEMLILPPFGKAKVSRQQENGTRSAMTVKLRRNSAGGQGKAKGAQSLAKAEE